MVLIRPRFVFALLLSAVASSALSAEPEALIKEHGCRICHDDTAWKAGPPFKKIAAKYQSNAQDGRKRALSALKDGVGHVKAKLSEEEIAAVTRWILER